MGVLLVCGGAACAWWPQWGEWARALWQAGVWRVSLEVTAAAAAIAGMGAFFLSRALAGGGQRVALWAGVAALAVCQAWLMGARGIGWEPWSWLATTALGMALGGWDAGVDSHGVRWFLGRLSGERLARLRGVSPSCYLSPEQRPATILTVRLLNDTQLREQLDAPQFLRLCDRVGLLAGEVLRGHGALTESPEAGTVRGFFGLPLAEGNHAVAACQAAFAVEESLRALATYALTLTNKAGHLAKLVIPEIGVGITSGVLTAGLSGGHYSAAGDAVEQSRWLAGLNAEYQTRLLLDDETRSLSAESGMLARPLEILNPPEGAAVAVDELRAPPYGLSIAAMERLAAYGDGIALLRGGYAADALLRFDHARAGLEKPDVVLERFATEAAEQVTRDEAGRLHREAEPAAPLIPQLPPRKSSVKTGRKRSS